MYTALKMIIMINFVTNEEDKYELLYIKHKLQKPAYVIYKKCDLHNFQILGLLLLFCSKHKFSVYVKTGSVRTHNVYLRQK